MGEFVRTFEIRTGRSRFGVGATEEIGSTLEKINVRRSLILCGKTISRSTEIPAKVKKIIEEKKIEVEIWDKLESRPTMVSIEGAINFVKEKEFDCVVGVGGGSTIVVSKIIALYCSYPKTFYDFLPPPLGRAVRVSGKIKPLFLLPTTAGSGSEVSEFVDISFWDESGNRKTVAFSSEYFLPNLTILDPLNTVSMPPELTAGVGFEALLIAIGAYTSKPYYTKIKESPLEGGSIYTGSNPFSDMLAEKSIELIGKCFVRSYVNGNDLEAREGMLFASHLAGLSVGKAGVHIPHALTISMDEIMENGSSITGISSLTAPACLDFIAPVVPIKINRIAQLLSAETESERREMELSASEILKKMSKDMKRPNGIGGLGFEEKDIPKLSERAFQEQRLLAQCPRLITKEDIRDIFQASLRHW